MLQHWMTAMALAAATMFFVHSDGLAGGKKDDTKKAEKSQELSVEGELVATDVKDKVRKQSYCKVYTFKMTEGKIYQIDMKSNVIDSYLRLEEPSGKEVAQDDDGGGFPDARIKFTAPKTGDYQIIATTFAPATGKFSLTVKETGSGGAPAGKAIELKMAKGEAQYEGALAAEDPLFKNKKHKAFVFNMEAGKTYQIDMKSKAVDSYLFLEDPSGNEVAHDDDSGGNLDARIVFKAAVTGKHRIIATAFGFANMGEFNLSVKEVQPKQQNHRNNTGPAQALRTARVDSDAVPAIDRRVIVAR